MIVVNGDGKFERIILVKLPGEKFYYPPHYIDFYKNILVLLALVA